LFFKDEIMSENSTAAILPQIILISFLFFFGHHCGKFVSIKNEMISTTCERKQAVMGVSLRAKPE